jgi:short-subunit dehydrogenase
LGALVRAEVIVCDVAEIDARAGLFEEIGRRGLTLDVLVNNAGVGTLGAVATASPDDEMLQVRVNVEAVADLTTRAVRQMTARGCGAILNIGSTIGFHPFPGQSCYAATKAFVIAYSEGLRAELTGTGVTVAALCPGPVRTEFFTTAGMDDDVIADALPKFLWMPSRSVAAAGVDALARDSGTVVPGLAVKLNTLMCRLMPRRILLRVLAARHPALHRGDT